LLVIATTIIAGFLTFDATNFNRNVTPHWIWFKKRSISSIWKFISEFLQTKSHRFDEPYSEDVSKVRMYVGPAVMYTINTVIRFAIVIVYMYNVANIDFVYAATASFYLMPFLN
jgi:ATP-binding cassette subfamily B protein